MPKYARVEKGIVRETIVADKLPPFTPEITAQFRECAVGVNNGSTGETSSFGAHCSATGGIGGSGSPSYSVMRLGARGGGGGPLSSQTASAWSPAAGNNGNAYGGGGSGASARTADLAGGNGAAGAVIVWEYK